MATSKQYAWYIEGSQIAIVEKDVSFDNDVDSKDYGPGASRQRWESPQSSVTDGLEVKYVYAPTYRVNDLDATESISSYEEDSGRLKLTISASSHTADDWLLITGLDRWNGLHQVYATTSSSNKLVVKTKYNGGAVQGFVNEATYNKDISVLEDESFELDLPLYLQKALVYYIRGKLAEDAGELKLREYAMREFKKMIEKYENSRISGLRITSSGSHAIR